MAKKSSSSLKKGMTFSGTQVMLFVLAFAAVGAVAIWQSLAAPHKNTATTSGTATLSVSPNPASVGDKVNFAGCGYAVMPITLKITNAAGYSQAYAVGMWSSGCMDTAYWPAAAAGTYTVSTYQKSSTATNATDVLKASTTLTVQ